jgi:hypothetical protein
LSGRAAELFAVAGEIDAAEATAVTDALLRSCGRRRARSSSWT